jgi:hypothetical protein
MLALKEACIHPTTKKPYIQTSVGGRDNSPEGHQVVVLLLHLHGYWLIPIGWILTWLRVTFRERRGPKILLGARSSSSGVCEELGWHNTKCQSRRLCARSVLDNGLSSLFKRRKYVWA